MFEILSKHLALLSAAAIVLASTIVMVFIYAYLSVFDQTLVWVLESSDIAKFSLLAVAFLSAFFIPFIYFIEYSYQWVIRKNATMKYIFIAILFIMLLSRCYDIYNDFINKTGMMQYHIHLLVSYMFVIFFIFDSISFIHVKLEIHDLSRRITFLGIMLIIVGRTAGLHVRDVRSNQHDITINDIELSNAKIIMILSHHSIFYVGKDIIVAQTAQVNKIITKSPID